MNEIKYDIGLVGLGVMGRNFARNVADHNFGIIGTDRDKDKVDALNDGSDPARILGVNSIGEMIPRLKKPRAIMMLVPAGKPVDAVIDELVNQLEKDDIIIDCGNSHFTDTNRHANDLAKKQIHFLGVGVSGGSEGARKGPSIMPGGPSDAYDRIKPIFEAAAAHVNGDPCVTYLGPGSAGHYVKMVHNGIEYALMQVISESYDIMKRIGRLSNDDLANRFTEWNQGPLSSFLVEITSHIFNVRDNETDHYLIDMVLDAARQKGTGKWMSLDAFELQIPIPTIDTAVSMRYMSALKEERTEAARILPHEDTESIDNKQEFLDDLQNALHFAMIVSYAQGMSLLRTASNEYNYNLNLADIARIWRGGCIIRSAMLEDITNAFNDNTKLANMMTAKPFADILKKNRSSVIRTITRALKNGIAVPGLSSASNYFDSYRTARMPANLIQAQRDYFGSHTYERVDREGTFHSEWSS
jgi:6-phosphogluconate dehydrogenase